MKLHHVKFENSHVQTQTREDAKNQLHLSCVIPPLNYKSIFIRICNFHKTDIDLLFSIFLNLDVLSICSRIWIFLVSMDMAIRIKKNCLFSNAYIWRCLEFSRVIFLLTNETTTLMMFGQDYVSVDILWHFERTSPGKTVKIFCF